ncbi:MAG: prepilin-type N-terminal cleavage/methylation domain-containing protein [Candidatus Aminicenantes bacterium]|nr:prepilin-type N-terminal cleavage/methylation domain-containing protein [Candidatus Aminicenantes bacterium]
MRKRFLLRSQVSSRRPGFTLIEVLVGIFLVAVGVVGLTQLFLLSVISGYRADQISRATFLAQQRIDELRNLTQDELSTLARTSLNDRDVPLDLNADGVDDFRMVTRVQESGFLWGITILVFGPETALASSQPTALELIADPERYKVLAQLGTIITR